MSNYEEEENYKVLEIILGHYRREVIALEKELFKRKVQRLEKMYTSNCWSVVNKAFRSLAKEFFENFKNHHKLDTDNVYVHFSEDRIYVTNYFGRNQEGSEYEDRYSNLFEDTHKKYYEESIAEYRDIHKTAYEIADWGYGVLSNFSCNGSIWDIGRNRGQLLNVTCPF